MIEVIVLDKELYHPSEIAPKTAGSAGLDLKLTRDAKTPWQLHAEGSTTYQDLIGTGLKVKIPTNMVGLIVPRSSAGHKDGFRIGNTIGIIDSDYRGELMMSIGSGDFTKMKRGYVCAQLVLVPYSSFYGAKIVDEFSDADTAYGKGCRAEGGFGSTDQIAHGMVLDGAATAKGIGVIMRPQLPPCPGCGVPEGVAHEVFCPSQNLSSTARGAVGNARHEAGCQQIEEYNINKTNGGF